MTHVNPAAIKVWRISNSLVTLAALLFIAVVWLVKYLYFGWLPMWVVYMLLGLITVQFVWSVLIQPTITYQNFRYEVKEDELMIIDGIVVKNQQLIPFTRIQNVETTVGPIMKHFGLKTVEITTAGGSASIHLIEDDEAERIKREISEVVKQLERRRWQ